MMRPLRIAAVVVAIVAAGLSLWGWLGLPGIWVQYDPVLTDPYYQQAAARQVVMLGGPALGVSLAACLLAWSRRARGRVASIAVWLMLFAVALVFVLVAAQLWHAMQPLSMPRRVSDLSGYAARARLLNSAYLGAWISLLAGAGLWIASYWLDKPREPA